MKRDRALVAFLAIFLILIVNPSMSSIPAAIVDEPFEAPFLTAADGAESSESLTSFSETSADDTRLYPDADSAIGFNELNSSSVLNENETDVIWNDPGPIWWRPYRAGGYSSTGGASNATMIEMWGYKSTPLGPVEIEVCYYLNTSIVLTNDHLFYIKLMAEVVGNYRIGFYNGSTEYYTASFPIAAETWTIITALDLGNIVTGTVSRITVENDPTASYEAGANHSIWVDYHHLTDIPVDTNEDIYAESFVDVSDCLIMDDEGNDTFTSDGDLLHFESKTDSEDDGESVYSNVPSLVGQYLEIRYRLNTTSLATFAVGTYSSDGGLAGNINWFGMTITTSWTTSKFPINSDTVIESVRLYIYHVTGQPPVDLQVDYLRIGPADEMGFCHDGSTTAGVGTEAFAGSSYSYSSDGDILTLTANRTGAGSNWGHLYINQDTTATAAEVERDYYPFFAAKIRVTDNNCTSPIYFRTVYDGYVVTWTITDSTTWTVYRWNHKSVTSSSGVTYDHSFYTNFGGVGESFSVDVEYLKAYSIANFTYTPDALATVSEYFYVDSGVLVSTCTHYASYLHHDPALSVDTNTYNVVNATIDSATSFEWRENVAGWKVILDAESRAEMTSGTLTDMIIGGYGSWRLSAIKFIEDGTAPAVVRSSSTPNDPEDDETVTLSAVITDTVEVYSVAFNAIVYPTGFSDVDYSANEQADNLWNYTFSSLDAGYYCFKIIASDGANTNALTEYAYIELSVREAAIRVEEITLIGAGSDFTMMTFSARINRDCSFTIYEESASSAEADTHTGSVTAPSFNLAWTKLDVDDANVNFTIRFTSGSLTYNYTSQYQVAQTTFYVSTVTQMVSLDTVTVTGRITKLGAYQVYDDLDVLKDYGSITDLDFKIQFTRWGGYDEQNHDFAIKFTNGSQTCWYNSSFYAFKKPVVAPFPIEDKNALYAFQVSFWTLIAVVAVGGMVVVQGKREISK